LTVCATHVPWLAFLALPKADIIERRRLIEAKFKRFLLAELPRLRLRWDARRQQSAQAETCEREEANAA
jgi:hypothetical protein